MEFREANMLDVAIRFRKQGWYSVPIPFREKGPRLDGWQNLRLNTREQLAAHFNGQPQNIGVLLGACSGNIVDCDLDQPECLAFAEWMLPNTRIFGRSGNKHSHWIFRSVTTATRIQFFVLLPNTEGGPKKKHTVIELRANDHQTVFPPSTHESGEPILWRDQIPLTEIEFSQLQRLAGRIAAGAVLAQAWPREKSCRHPSALALATMLLRSGFTAEDAERFILTIGIIAGTEDAAGRARNEVATTAERLHAGKRLTAWKTLSQLLNKPELLAKVPEWLGYPFVGSDDEPDPPTETAEEPVGPFPLELVIPATQLVTMPLAAREDIIDDVLYTQSYSMLSATRGLGKTRCVLTMLDAITKGEGESFFAWTVAKKRRCLLVDGELPAIDLQQMIHEMCGTPSPLLEVCSSEFFFHSQQRPLNLCDHAHQARLIGLLEALERADRRPELIAFDNQSSLMFGIDENSNSDQDVVQPFFMELRHRGYSSFVVHHTGHDVTRQRGASRREDLLDLAIRLTPLTETTNHSCQFKFEFSKIRRKPPKPFSIECELLPGAEGRLVWAVKVGDDIDTWVQCLRLCQTLKPENQQPIVSVLNLDKGNVSRYLKKARDKGLLDGLKVTRNGERYLARIYGVDE